MSDVINKMEAIFVPDWSQGNPYQILLKKGLEEQGISVFIKDYPRKIFPLNRLINASPAVSVIHLHWVNSLVDPIAWCDNRFKRAFKLTLLATDIFFARLRRRRIIWTVHNLVSHESKNSEREILARRIIALMCSHILVHSTSALRLLERTYRLPLEKKATVTPHGNYDGCYPGDRAIAEKLRHKYLITENDIVVLFFGAIRPYKGIERLLSAFLSIRKTGIKLLIAGNVTDATLSQAIYDAVKNNNQIVPAIGFVPENEVESFFSLADIVALPFERTLTSGSATLACTMGKALLVPEEARVFDFVTNDNAFFFSSDDCLARIISKLDKTELAIMGQHARKAVAHFSWTYVSSLVAKVYN